MMDERTCRECMKYECPLKKNIPYIDLLRGTLGEDVLLRMDEEAENAYDKEDAESSLEQYKRIFFRYMKMNHAGEENAIFSRDLEALFQLSGRYIRRIVSSLRKNGIPICSDSHKGYYYAKKPSEIADTLKGLSEHIAEASDMIEMLNKVKIAERPRIRSIRVVITSVDGSEK